ncbi:NADH-quinone oxidoreductase subunit NuoG [Sinimarinibacterium sp. NLF-5-8]|uniref:NADH-quinone oxidoreductase subunit NuoG n=1 Tax=Sinimarinibacterium sp. NLF-5-8 TaxID=2698684 RepID=UPI00137BAA8F|nr:NADH-quinone oxidoreductase subunit NuoG [Sinimarinibacterium sp. NLF-5-8]QHS10228.1 NADH-quinone oxidoreductase subunit NuoG [Sinimarinibacterium sp. NLF-5-8]
MSAAEKPPVTITINGENHVVDGSKNLLQTVLDLGYDLQYFCWHPALGSVGACRQCAVTQYKDADDKNGRVVMACMTPVTDNLRISLNTLDAVDMREAVVELLMTNHPHDCPVCEEGGQCHLQDMTVMTGHNYRRYNHTKRTHHNQDLGPFVGHEMNRCIACYRCVRFYREYAGGDDLNVFASAARVYFGRDQDGTLESPFSGNLAEVCPTGVFTDKTYGDSYTRKWDLQQAPSVCHHCAVGCNTMPGERYGKIKRIENRYNSALNGYFLCDRGRYGYQHTNADDRPRAVRFCDGDNVQCLTLNDDAALQMLSGWIRGGRALGIGSPRASVEANYALQQVVGSGNFYRGTAALDTALDDQIARALQTTDARIASLHDVEQCDAVLVIGEDVTQTAARLSLALRQSTRQHSFAMADAARVPRWQDHSVRLLAQDDRSPLFLLTPNATDLDSIAAATARVTAVDAARIAQQVVHLLDATQAPVDALTRAQQVLAQHIAEALKAAKRPLVVAGSSSGSPDVLTAANNVCTALKKAGQQPWIVLMPTEANSMGTALLGGSSLDAALARVDAGEVDTLIVVENDLYRRLPQARVDAALAKVQHLVVIDAIATPTTEAADLLLPSGSFAETSGTMVNFEARAQRYFQTMVGQGDVRPAWHWLQQLAQLGARPLGETLDDIIADCARAQPVLAGMVEAAPSARFRIHGNKIPRQSQRYSGRTAMTVNRDIHEPRPPQDADSALAFTMEGDRQSAPAAEIPIFWAPKWNSSAQAVNKFTQEINGPLKGGDPGVRLIAPNGSAGYQALTLAPQLGTPLQWLYELFGSEELSLRGAAIASRIPAPYVVLNPRTAAQLGVDKVSRVRISAEGAQWEAELRLRETMTPAVIGVPRGIPGAPTLSESAQLTLEGC